MMNPPAKVLLGLVSLGLLCGVAQAQDEPQPPKPPVFPTLFQNPVGVNAYEDWVYAGDLVQNNRLADAMMEPDAPLALKRQLCSDPAVQQALLRLHTSLDKPAQAPPIPQEQGEGLSPAYAEFRKLARLMGTQIQVYFADGRVDAALETLNDGLRFSSRLQSGPTFSGLVGVAIEAIVVKDFARHLDQLSEYHCRRLQRMMEDWLETPSPVMAVLVRQKQEALQELDAKRNDLKGLGLRVVQHYDRSEDLPPEGQALLERLQTRPGDIGPALDDARTLINLQYDSVLAALKLPIKERRPLQEVETTTLGGKLFTILDPSFDYTMSRYDRRDATFRLLRVHAAIHRYRWEHNRLPDSLADLHVGALNTDPFTGKGFLYRRDGDTYDLSSFGPVERDAQGKASSMPNRPIRL